MQCVSSSEPDLVSPTVVAEGAQSPSDSSEYFEHGGEYDLLICFLWIACTFVDSMVYRFM